MKRGTLENGFEYEIEDERFDNYELLETLAKVDKGEMQKIVEVAPMLMGEKQTERLKEHIRGENGIVSAKEMFDAVAEILTGSQKGKN